MTTTVAPPRDTRSRGHRIRVPALVAGGILGASVLIHLRDPHQPGSWGYCPWLLLTGTFCPGCGGLRAVNDLTRGDLGAAASSNLLFVGSVPLVAAWWTRSMLDGWRGVVRRTNNRRVVLGCLVLSVLAMAFGVLRNVPAGSWLAP